jgi:hypothetical protein
MQTLTKILRKFIGLFVDDGSLAIIIVTWIAICGVALPNLVPVTTWRGPTLFMGLALILVENVLRGAKGRLNYD